MARPIEVLDFNADQRRNSDLCFDRGYLDFSRLLLIAQAGAWFAIRAKCNTCFCVCESRTVDEEAGLRWDQTIRLDSKQDHRDYSEKLRRI